MADGKELEKCKEAILKSGLATKQANSLKKQGISVDHLAPSTHWRKIKYYTRINTEIKKDFKGYLSNALPDDKPIIELEDMPTNNNTGQRWDKILGDYLTKKTVGKEVEKKMAGTEEEKKMAGNEEKKKKRRRLRVLRRSCMVVTEEEEKMAGTEEEEKMAEMLICQLKKTYEGLRFLKSKFRIFGFMRDNAVKKKPKSYLWQGEADAIASYEGKYTIVDFKVIDYDILDYKRKATALCGMHLHQCLIYAQLLKLHMDLEYLPPILIVVIDRSQGGSLIYPPLFKDYPPECKEKLNSFEWSKEDFTEKPPLELTVDDGKLFQKGISGDIDAELELTTDIFLADAKLKDLLDMLGYGSLKVERVKQESEE